MARALGNPAVNLPLADHRVDDHPEIVDRSEAIDGHRARLGIDLDLTNLAAVGIIRRPARRAGIGAGGLQAETEPEHRSRRRVERLGDAHLLRGEAVGGVGVAGALDGRRVEGAGVGVADDAVDGAVASDVGASVAQVAIAWVIAQGSDILPLIGARRRDRLAEALGALDVTLTPAQLAALAKAIPAGAAAGARYPEAALAHMDSERRA